MTERPIIFSAESVRAILDGRKTETRRVIRVPRSYRSPYRDFYPAHRWWVGPHPGGGWWAMDAPDGPRPGDAEKMTAGTEGFPCPHGRRGHRLWVRETWGCPSADHPRVKDGRRPEQGDRIAYRANNADDWQWSRAPDFVWRSPIYMPRWASRLLLEVEEVAVERVQEIDEGGAAAEGVVGNRHRVPVDAFRDGWDALNAKRGYSWEANPWVWVVRFRALELPMEADG